MDVDDDSVGATVLTQVTAAMSGVPAPLQRTLFKAIHRLCLSAVEWPAAALEGKAAEIRAASAARASLTEMIGSKLAESASVDPLAVQAAVDVHTKKILGRQFNIDAVVRDAVLESVNNVESQPSEATEAREFNEVVKDDWLDYFEREAEMASSDDLRLAFGKILAGECRRPGSFSKSTLRVLSQLSQETANSFQLFCNLSTRIRTPNGNSPDVRVWDLGKDVGGNELQEFGIDFPMILDLMEAGLVSTSLTSSIEYGALGQTSDKIVVGTFKYGNKLWGLVPLPPQTEMTSGMETMDFGGPSLTRVGRELANVVTVEEDVKYTSALKKYLAEMSIARAEVRWDSAEQKYVQRIDP